MYILYQGEVSVIAGEDDKITTVLHENQVFGERALSKDEKRVATIIANTPKTICLALYKKEYKDIVYVRCFLYKIIFIACASSLKVKKAVVFAESSIL